MKKYEMMRQFLFANIVLVLLSFALNIFSGYSKSIGALYLQKITDSLAISDTNQLPMLVAIGGFLTFSSYVLRWLGAIVANYLTEKFSFLTRINLFEHLSKIPFATYESYSKGETQSVFQNDSNQAGKIFYIFLSRISSNIFLFIFSIWVMARAQLTATFVSVFIVIFATLINQRILRHMKEHSKAAQKNLAEMTHSLECSFSGIQTVKTFDAKEYVLKNYQKKQDQYCKSKLKATKVGAFQTLWYTVTENTCLYGSILYLGVLGLRGDMSIGEVLMFIYLIKQIIMPIEVVFRWMSSLPSVVAGWERVLNILKTNVTPDKPACITKEATSLQLSHVNFSYSNKHPILHEAKLYLKKNEITGLLGSSGSGKSTLLKIAAGLYTSDTMTVAVDNMPCDLSPYDAAYSCLDQSILPVTLYENISLGDPNITHANVLDTLTQLGFGSWVSSLSDGLNTMLHEGLSGGQKQAVANARVICSNRAILIFDEPFSALDTEKDTCLSNVLNQAKQYGFVVVTSHREPNNSIFTHVETITTT